jgi:replicative DNA helicase
MTKDLEARLLASLPSVEAFEGLSDQGIRPEAFIHHRPLYNYIAELVREHRHLPRLRDLKAVFNLPAWVERKPHEFEWLVSEFQRLATAREVQDIVERGVEQYGDDPDALVNTLIRNLSTIASQQGKQISVTDSSAEARFKRYAEKAPPAGVILGIPTGLSYFDAQVRLGWLPGELIGVIGRTYLGKSWMLLYHGVRAWQNDKRVLFLTPELTVEEAEARFDGLVCGLHDIPVSVTELYRGFYPTEAQKALASETAKRANWTTLSSATGKPFGLQDIPRLLRQFQPDLLLIDGLPHMVMMAKGRQSAWEQMLEVSYGLKDIAVGSEIPIMVAHQANRAAHNTARPPGLHEIYMGDSFAHACDRVLVLSQPKSRPNELKITIQKFRKGKPLQGGISLDFDPDRGVIREHTATADGPGSDGEGAEEGEGASAEVLIP